jgi:hypothetical protein
MINGYEFDAIAEHESVAFVIGLYETNSFNFERLVPWLRAHTKPIS